MPGMIKGRTLLFALALGLLSACGGTESSDGVAAAGNPASATTCSGYVGLSFDDGPTTNTSTLLGILKNNGARATFFNIGQNAAANPSLVRAEADAGMWIGNHSYTHQHMSGFSQAQDQDEMSRTSQAIVAGGGATPKLFRPPYGETSTAMQAAASALGLRVLTWDVDSQDWNGASTASIVSTVSNMQNGQVVLMHDGYSTTNAAIPQFLANLANRGLCPGMIDPSTGRAVAPSGSSYTLTVTKSGTGSGTVTSNTGGISCGATCSAGYAPGTSVTLTATAASGSTFGGWGGACSGTATTCTVTVSAAQSVSATFNGPTGNTLTVTKGGTGTGTVTSSPAGISCGSTCSATFASGASVTLTAVADGGSTFTTWGGACAGSGSATTCTVSMSAAQSVTATFAGTPGTGPCANPVTLTTGNSGNFNTSGAICYRTSATVNGWGCYNMDGRTVSVNGAATTCGKAPVAKYSDGYTYFGFSAGTYAWAGFYYW